MVSGGLHSEIRTEEAKGKRQAPRRINVLAIIVADVGTTALSHLPVDIL